MREIKFRAKNEKTNEWVYGYYTATFQCGPDWTKHEIHEDYTRGFSYEVIEETVGQLLYSEDGNEYYEGDKVLMHTFAWDGSDGAEIEGVLAFDVFGIGVDTGDGNSYLLSDYIQEFTEQLEVVGNIHEVDKEWNGEV